MDVALGLLVSALPGFRLQVSDHADFVSLHEGLGLGVTDATDFHIQIHGVIDFVRHVVGIDGDGEAQELALFRVILREVRDEPFEETMIEIVGFGHDEILSSEWSVPSADAVN
jgi:hypothetical protein